MPLSAQPRSEALIERRVTHQLIRYWNEVRGDAPFPMENDIDPGAIGGLWPNCYLVQVRDILHEDGNYTYLGSAIRKAFHAGLDGEQCRHIISPNYKDLGHNFTTVLDEKRPIFQEGEFRNMRAQRVLYRQCMLPLGGRGADGVSAILGCMAFKVVA